jgi:hypothetical protein
MLVLTRTRGSWRAVEPPDPWGNQVLYEAPSMPRLYFAACDPVSLCVASGDYQVVGDQFSPVDGLIETIRVPVG